MVEVDDENARVATPIVTVLSFSNLIKIGTQWASSKSEKIFNRLQNNMHVAS